MRTFLMLLVMVCTCGTLSAQPRFTLDVRGGLLVGGFRDQMYSPMSYAKSGFTASLGGRYEFGKSGNSRIELRINYAQAGAGTTVSDDFRSNYYGLDLSASYLHRLWQPSEKLNLWIGGGYSFGLDGLIWKMQNYTYIASHNFAPILHLDWMPADRHVFSTRFSAYLFGFVSRPPYNYMPDYNEKPRESYFSYLMRELSHADFTFVGRYWNVNWAAEYHYRITPRFMLGIRYGFRFQRYRESQPVSQFDNALTLSAKIRL